MLSCFASPVNWRCKAAKVSTAFDDTEPSTDIVELVAREVTGERIRDKIAASKRKGLWMGGVPPLGYDVANRLLVVNETEADLVRRIFREMLTIGSPTRIAQGLASEGITTKAWTTQDGQVRSGTQMDRKYLYKLLRNRIYLGELSHKGSWFPGAHLPVDWQAQRAIIDGFK